MTTKLTRPFGKYVHARRAGTLLFLAGQGARDPETDAYAGLSFDAAGDLTAHDTAAQSRAVLANIERALAANGLDRRHLVDVTVFLTDMAEFEAMNGAWAEFFAECAPPTRTTVAVRGLPGLNFVEMKAVAAFPLDDVTQD